MARCAPRLFPTTTRGARFIDANRTFDAARRVGFALDSGPLEALKWLALAAMLVDHVNTAFFGHSVGWMLPIGRIAMPLFTLVLAYNMARPGVDLSRLLRRLLLVGMLSQPFHAVVLTGGAWHPLDVLFTFAAGVAVILLAQRGRWFVLVALLLFALLWADYSLAGVAMLVTGYLYFQRRTPATLVALVVSVLGLCVWNGNAWALWGVALFLWASRWRFEFPRWRWAFWVAYPAHLVVLAWALLVGV